MQKSKPLTAQTEMLESTVTSLAVLEPTRKGQSVIYGQYILLRKILGSMCLSLER